MKYKVGDEIIIFDAKLAGIDKFFQGKIVKVIELNHGLIWINSSNFFNPEINRHWNKGWVEEPGIRLATPLDKAMN